MRSLTVAALLLLDSATPIIRRHDVPDERYLVAGAGYPAVVPLGRFGDATLISSRWLLSAAHVARGLERRGIRTLTIAGAPYGIEGIVIHPRWREMEAHDIALIRLDRAVAGIQPIGLYRGAAEKGAIATLVGHGGSGGGDSRRRSEDGRRRAATSTVDSVSDAWLYVGFDAPPAGTGLEGAPGPGDSGGPAILTIAGEPVVAGVSSAGFDGREGPGTYGAVDLFTRVSTHLEWIDSVMQPAGPGGAGSAGSAYVIDPRRAAAELFTTDSTFAAQAAQKKLPDALAAMFADDIVMGAGREHVFGRSAALAALQANPENATSTIAWTPIRSGVSSDGRHGFTQGYISTIRANGTRVDGKYLGYWVRGGQGWRLAVYKRVGRPPGDVSLVPAPPSLPEPGLPAADAASMARYRQEIIETESAFSADATTLGIGPAFLKWGAADAMNLGAGPEWARGPAAISSAVASFAQPGRRTTWSADSVIVSPTGDLAVAIGYITQHVAGSDLPPTRFPFFTIWKRSRPGDPWRYIAE